jgi:hypothetical protein
MSSFRRHGDPRLRRVTTLREAIALMVPGLPPTDGTSRLDAYHVGPVSDVGPFIAIWGASLVVFLSLIGSRRRRRS